MKHLNILILIYLSACNCKKINYPRLLLPIFDSFSVNFTLEVIENGCFSWKANRPDLLRITPIYDDGKDECSNKAVVSPVLNRGTTRRSTPVVLIEDLDTHEVLRCDVILDVIHTFKVITTTRELFLKEAPEKFELMAHDVYGNAFTSLENVLFDWEILQHSRADHYTEVLRFLKFSESAYHEVPDSMKRLDELGATGYMILLDGINTGQAKVSVRLPYPEYEQVPIVEVDIMVLANILLDPNDVHILVGDHTRFSVLQITQGTLTDISSNDQYYMEMEKANIAKIVDHSAIGQELGKSRVLLRDRNVAGTVQAIDGSCPSATLSVVEPAKLIVELLPDYNWVTVEGRLHDIVFTIVTKDEQRVILGDVFRVKSSIDSNHFHVSLSTKNGTHNSGQALREGKSIVSGQFEGLFVEAELHVYKRITLAPKIVVLPFGQVQNAHVTRIQFIASGGDGNYMWTVDNKQLVTVNKNGLAEVRLSEEKMDRRATVKMMLQRNHKVFETATIMFLEPIKLEITEYNFETAINDYVRVRVALFAEEAGTDALLPVTDCGRVHFELSFSETIFQDRTDSNSTEHSGNSCHVIVLKAIALGSTQLTVTYRHQDRVLVDSVHLVVFDALRLVHPAESELVLPIGSSQNVIFRNGPEKLFNFDAELKKILEYTESVIQVTELPGVTLPSTMNINAFTVLCKKVGESEFHLRLGNVLTSKKSVPYYFQHSTLRVFCVNPRFIHLISRSNVNDACPINVKMHSLMQTNGSAEEKDAIDLEFKVLDASNRKLKNITSLEISWRLIGPANELQDVKYTRSDAILSVENVPVSGAFLLHMNKLKGPSAATNFKLIGAVVGYNQEVLRAMHVDEEVRQFEIQKSPGEPHHTPSIESELNFMIVNGSLLPFDRITIYIKSTQKIKILQGSGHYELSITNPNKVIAEFDHSRQEIIIKPQEIGETSITVFDRCLSSLKQVLTISVVAMEKIELRVTSRVERTMQVEAIIRLLTVNDEPLKINSDNLDTYELSVNVVNEHILSMELADDQSRLQDGEIRYRVTGLIVGETKLSVSSRNNAKIIAVSSIQVFPPLQLLPKNLTILVGASMQVSYRGGPQPDVVVQLEAVDEKMLRIESAVVSGLRLGQTRVIGRCIGFDQSVGSPVTFSQDSIVVNVIPLEAVKIVTPLVKMIQGAVMPASIWALPNIAPSTLGTINNLRVSWSTDRTDTLEISNAFAALGIDNIDSDLISVRIRGLKPGKAQLNAKVVAPNGKTMYSFVEISVVADLTLQKPKNMNTAETVLTMPPNSEIQLKANTDDAQFQLNNVAARNLINITESGLVTSGNQIGFASIMMKSLSCSEQELPIMLRVKSIQYIMVSVYVGPGLGNANWRLKETKIPRGLTIQLKVTLHDSLGNEILHNWSGTDHLGYEISRPDGLSVQIDEDFKLTVILLEETTNILTVTLRGLNSNVKYAEDYVQLSVAQSPHTFPTLKEIFSTADVVCFDSVLSAGKGIGYGNSKWTSSNNNVLNINERTGVAVVNHPQDGQQSTSIRITNEDEGAVMTFDVEVRQADDAEFLHHSRNFIKHTGGGEYRVYAVIKNRLQGTKLTNLIARNVSRCVSRIISDVDAAPLFSCHILRELSDGIAVADKLWNKVSIRPGFDPQHGQFYCAVILANYDQDWIPFVRKVSPTLAIELRLANGVASSTELRIVSGVHVTPDRIRFSKESDLPEFVIDGRESLLKNLLVTASDNRLEIKKVSTAVRGQDGEFALRYQVKIVGSLDEVNFLTINVESPDSEQLLSLPVEWPQDTTCASKPFTGEKLFSSVLSLGIIISTIIGTLTCAYLLLWCSTASNSHSNAFQNGKGPKSSPVNGSYHQNQSGTFITQQQSITPPSSPHDQTNNSHQSFLNQSSSPLSPIYGDTGNTPISAHRRMNPRYM